VSGVPFPELGVEYVPSEGKSNCRTREALPLDPPIAWRRDSFLLHAPPLLLFSFLKDILDKIVKRRQSLALGIFRHSSGVGWSIRRHCWRCYRRGYCLRRARGSSRSNLSKTVRIAALSCFPLMSFSGP